MDNKSKREKFFKENPDIYNQYIEIKKVNSEMIGQNTGALRAIKEYAINNTDFYSKFSVDDEFPVMTKLDFINHKNEITSKEKFDKPFHISSTSGSTGIPFKVEQDYMKRMRTIADLKVYGEYADYPSHEKMLQLRAYNGQILDRTVDERENIWRYDIANLSGVDIEKLVLFILDWQPRVIFGYTSTMETICDWMIRNNKIYDFGVKSVLVGAEGLTDEIAFKIKNVFACPIYDRYSNMEMGIYSQREYGKTNFIINKASYYFEVLKQDSDTPAEENEVGRIVFTDLYNHRFPMIRYDTGDLGTYCLHNGEMELKEVYGRRVDCIYDSRGNMLSPHSITNKMWGIENIRQWQFIQKGKTEYIIKIIKKDDIDEIDVQTRLKEVLGNDANINIEYVESIPVMNSSKRKYIINQMKNK